MENKKKIEKIEKNSRKKKDERKKIGHKHHFMTFHFITCHSHLMLHGEMFFSRLYPRIKKWVIHWKPESAQSSTFRRNLGTIFKR